MARDWSSLTTADGSRTLLDPSGLACHAREGAWTELIRTHRVSDLPHFLTRDDALVYIGTALGETWRGQLVRDGIADHMAEVPDFTEDEVEIEAYEHGETGWATYQSSFSFHDTGKRGTHRATFVFVLERGSWKMIQHHISEASSNMVKGASPWSRAIELTMMLVLVPTRVQAPPKIAA